MNTMFLSYVVQRDKINQEKFEERTLVIAIDGSIAKSKKGLQPAKKLLAIYLMNLCHINNRLAI